VWEA